ncbi:MAG: hypothetical protein J2P45_14825 [Candidatus Dormibacteraeota bacterium]|nr:hypothetical protein [Candidatus Dormibacteraeota bacterium]
MLNIEPELGTFRIRAQLVREGSDSGTERVVRPPRPAFRQRATSTPRGRRVELPAASPSPRGELRAAWR